ncbi:hypothetical protein RIF29_13260 [Crotalaria pallida]|uniref:Uncharacterized protein n=1 Tax=Crotalaria pallida TaxID=3830 RepID=A0AAN9IP15_CROPI
MAKKKGKPPNQTQSPNSATKKDNPHTVNESIVIDFSKLDEIDLDTLPKTQVEKALAVLEEIRGKLADRVVECSDGAPMIHVGAVGGVGAYGSGAGASSGAAVTAPGASAYATGAGDSGASGGAAPGVAGGAAGLAGAGAISAAVGAGSGVTGAGSGGALGSSDPSTRSDAAGVLLGVTGTGASGAGDAAGSERRVSTGVGPSVWDNFDISKLWNAGEKLKFYKLELKEGTSFGKIEASDVEQEV